MDEDTSMNTEISGTTPEGQETQQAESTDTETDTAPQDQSDDGTSAASEHTEDTDAPENQESQPAETFVPVQYNHETRQLSIKEAAALAQKGLYYDGLYNKLDYLAAVKNQSVDELVDTMIANDDNGYRQSLVEKFGEDSDVIDKMMKVYHDEQKTKYDKLVSDRKQAETAAQEQKRVSLETRLADEYRVLKEEFPDVPDFKSLPASVKKSAAGGKDLLSAYLYYQHIEQKKISAAQKAAESAEKATAGAAATTETDNRSSDIAAMLRGVFGG